LMILEGNLFKSHKIKKTAINKFDSGFFHGIIFEQNHKAFL